MLFTFQFSREARLGLTHQREAQRKKNPREKTRNQKDAVQINADFGGGFLYRLLIGENAGVFQQALRGIRTIESGY
jgi:hypothetical protein